MDTDTTEREDELVMQPVSLPDPPQLDDEQLTALHQTLERYLRRK